MNIICRKNIEEYLRESESEYTRALVKKDLVTKDIKQNREVEAIRADSFNLLSS